MMEVKQISLQDSVKQSPGQIVSDMGGEKVMMSIDNGKYYNLGEIGGEIWSLLEKPISVQEVVTTLIDKYDVEKDECAEQVLLFLQQLYTEELVQVN